MIEPRAAGITVLIFCVWKGIDVGFHQPAGMVKLLGKVVFMYEMHSQPVHLGSGERPAGTARQPRLRSLPPAKVTRLAAPQLLSAPNQEHAVQHLASSAAAASPAEEVPSEEDASAQPTQEQARSTWSMSCISSWSHVWILTTSACYHGVRACLDLTFALKAMCTSVLVQPPLPGAVEQLHCCMCPFSYSVAQASAVPSWLPAQTGLLCLGTGEEPDDGAADAAPSE